jgi:hypothetical protein
MPKFNPDKSIYYFSATRPVKRTVKIPVVENEKVVGSTEKEVNEDETVTIAVVKPNRYLKEEAEAFHARTFNKLITEGF